MAWSPVRRTNAGRFEVDHPGDYATFNSYHPSYATWRAPVFPHTWDVQAVGRTLWRIETF